MNYFIRQYAEKGCPANAVCSHSLGTATMTKTIEGSDQDMYSQEALPLGTMTITENIEGADQDRYIDYYDFEGNN